MSRRENRFGTVDMRGAGGPRGRTGGGFTLVELVVVMAVSGVLFVAIATFTRSAVTTTATLQDQNGAQQVARTALARFAREAAVAKTITTAQATQFTFTCTDVTGDGADDTVDYQWDSGTKTLTRTVNGTSGTFAVNVQSFSLAYTYETETSVVIAGPGTSMGVLIGQFNGAGILPFYTDQEIDVKHQTWYVEQTFNAQAESSNVTVVTVRARTNLLPPPVDMYITVDDLTTTLAWGWLRASQLVLLYQDIPVSMTWCGPTGAKIQPGKTYRIRLRPGGPSPYTNYSGTLSYQKVLLGTPLTGGLTLGYWDGGGQFQSLGNMASLYFTALGNLNLTTPTRGTSTSSVLKSITATMTVSENTQQVQVSRTCKLVNQ